MCESEGARSLGDRNPPLGSRGKALVGYLVGGRSPPEAEAFVNECLNFDLLEEKNLVKLQKIPSSKKLGLGERRTAAGPLNTPWLKKITSAL